MKKSTKMLVLVALFAAGLSFTSCKKCSECVAKQSGTQVATSGEFCGSKKDVEETEDAFKSVWGSGYDVTCTRK